MKKQNILLATALSLIVLGSSCKKDNNHNHDSGNPGGSKAVQFTAAINGQIKTKASNDQWDAGDTIGVFMKTGTGLSNVLAANKSYLTTGDGAFTASATDQTIFYPDNGTVDFIAYYPFKKALTNNTYAVDVTQQANQSAIDLLYSNNATGLSKTSSIANLVFVHQLSKIEFTVTKGAGVTDLNGLAVSLGGQTAKANVDLASGTLTNTTSTADINAKTTAQAGGTALAEAILIPTADASGKVVTFSLPAGKFNLTLPSGTKYEQGKKYTYSIELKNGTAGTPVAVAISATITNWTDVPSGSYTVGQDSLSNPPTGTEDVLYTETFGTGSASTKPKVAAYTGWANPSWTFSDSFGTADLRTISAYPDNVHLWLPATKDASLKIEGIQVTGYTSLKLKYDLAPNAASASSTSDVNVISVKVNGTSITVPSRPLSNADNNKFVTVELSNIPVSATNTIEFMGSTATNTLGMRLDNVVIIGVK
ncbi:MAG: fimbrillin family protein [Mucilaginibacter sp.]|uniref:fimbrillin family protein n=1 Tax=Mucilaginibacter sp. TaxID=1882438 RepID=UPI0031AE32AC